nr:DNA repair protein RadC [Sphingomonas glacialis]
MADALLLEFGSLGRVLAASPARLRQVVPNAPLVVSHLSDTRTAMMEAFRSELSSRPLVSSWNDLLEYLMADMALLLNERVRVLHLNTRNLLIRDEVMSEGTIDQAAFYVREIVRRALELGSASIVVAHNHPSGSPEPSRADIDLTRRLKHGCDAVGVRLFDHVIVAAEGHASFRARGLL